MAASIVPSHSFVISISPSFTGGRGAGRTEGEWQTFPVPDSLSWSGAPVHACCYLTVWVTLGDKTRAKMLTRLRKAFGVLAGPRVAVR